MDGEKNDLAPCTSRRDFLGTVILGAPAVSSFSLFATWSAEGAEKILTVAIPSNPVTFDPVNAANHDAMVVSQTVFENLVEVDLEGKTVRPQLAQANRRRFREYRWSAWRP